MKVLRIALMLSVFTLAMFTPSLANAAPITFFGGNLTPGGTVSGAPLTARNSFLASLTGVGTEELETFANNATAPLALTFVGSSITATLTGSVQVFDTPANGRFNTTAGGDTLFETAGAFQIDFTSPISAFGFYATDAEEAGALSVTLRAVGGATTVLNINTGFGNDGSLLFWGFTDSAVQYDRITFGNSSAGADVIGFDSLTTGQVGGRPVPEPATLSLLGVGLGAAGLRRLRRRKA